MDDLKGLLTTLLSRLPADKAAVLVGRLGDRALDVERGGVVEQIVVSEGKLVVSAARSRLGNVRVMLSNEPGNTFNQVVDVSYDAGSLELILPLAELWALLGSPATPPAPCGASSSQALVSPNWASGANSPTVLVLGAGVTGLTAAQELVERGFNVVVLDQAVSNLDADQVAVGGIARTPMVRLPRESGKDGAFQAARTPLVLKDADFLKRLFVNGPDDPTWSIETRDTERAELAEAVRRAFKALAEQVKSELSTAPVTAAVGGSGSASAVPWVVACVGEFGPSDDAGDARKAAKAVRDWIASVLSSVPAAGGAAIATNVSAGGSYAAPLHPEDPVLTFTDSSVSSVNVRLVVEVERVSDVESRSKAATAVRLHVHQHLVPGEHGYRVFPGFYRHMFDTMRRIPLVDDLGRPSGQTAYDNLVPVTEVQMYRYRNSKDDRGAHTFPRRPARSLEELRCMFQGLRDFGFSDRDVALFEVRVLKYLTSCKARRAKEADGKHWQEYIGLEDFMCDGEFTRMGEALRDAPLSLLAAKAEQVDARTYLNTAVQLFIDHVRMDRTSDLTLNGPTSDALFSPWKQYLKSQGVRFFKGTVTALKVNGARLSATYQSPGPVEEGGGESDFPESPDYVLCALDLYNVFQLTGATSPSKKYPGDLQTLKLWQERTDREFADETARQRRMGEAPNSNFKFDQLGVVGPQKDHSPRWVPTGPFRVMSGIQYYFESGVRVGGKGHVYYIGAPWGVSSISQPAYWRSRLPLQNAGFISNLSVDLCHWYNDMFPAPLLGEPALDDPKAEVKRCSALESPNLAEDVWCQLLHPLAPWTRQKLTQPRWYNVDWNLVRENPEDATSPIVGNQAPYLINRPEDNAFRPKFGRNPGEKALAATDREHGSEAGMAYDMTAGNWVFAGPHMATQTRLTSMEAANESARHAVNTILYAEARKEGGTLLGEFCDTWDPEDNELPDLGALRRLDERMIDRGLPHAFDVVGLEKAIVLSPADASRKLDTLIRDAFSTLYLDSGAVPAMKDWEQLVLNLIGEGRKWFEPRGK